MPQQDQKKSYDSGNIDSMLKKKYLTRDDLSIPLPNRSIKEFLAVRS